MTKEEETLKYLSAMSIIDFDKLGFVYGKQTIDEVLNLIQTQQSEIERKDKIIDEMANYIRVITVNMKIPTGENLLWDNDEIKQYFERKIEQ